MKKTNTHFLKFFCLLLGILFWTGNTIAQDFCTTATPLPVSGSCTNVLGSNVGATPSGEAAPSCGNFATGEDTWFSIMVPASGEINILASTAGGPTDWAMSVYSGACGALTEVECDDDDGPGLFPFIELTGQTPGDVLLVRVWEWGNNASGVFNICAYGPDLVCDLALTSETFTDETCPGVEDGTITLAATTTFGPISYAITGPVSMMNTTGSFTDLPQGDYTYTITDTGFSAAGACEILGGPITIGGDNIDPVVTCPAGGVIAGPS